MSANRIQFYYWKRAIHAQTGYKNLFDAFLFLAANLALSYFDLCIYANALDIDNSSTSSLVLINAWMSYKGIFSSAWVTINELL